MTESRFCPSCGAAHPPGAAFCPACGKAIPPVIEPAAPPAARTATPPAAQPAAPPVATPPAAQAPLPAATQPPAAWTPAAQVPARPMGLAILAALAGIGGALSVIGGLQLFQVDAGAFGLLYLVLGAADLAVAWGCWSILAWAWSSGIAVCSAQLALAILGLVSGDVGGGVIGVAVNGAVLYYLDQPHIRHLFGRGPSRLARPPAPPQAPPQAPSAGGPPPASAH